MKILFTADLHINLRQKNVPKQWAIGRYGIMFAEIAIKASESEAEIIIIGGDIFDKVPTLEELNMFVGGLYALYIANTDALIYIYDGNHEATRKGKTFLTYLKPLLPEYCTIIDEYTHYTDFTILPYCKLHEYEKKNIAGDCLFTHVRGEIPPHVTPEVNLEMFDNFDIVFAGDLHAHSNSQRNIVYPGSPVTVTYHRNKVKTGVIAIDTKAPKKWEWIEIQTPQLIRKTVSNPKDMIKTTSDHTIYELVGDIIDLANVEHSDILDKKIIQHNSESALDLKNLSITEEIALYCSSVLQLSPEKTTKILNVYNDYTQDANVG